jgi:hypothetical protein
VFIESFSLSTQKFTKVSYFCVIIKIIFYAYLLLCATVYKALYSKGLLTAVDMLS